MNHQKRGISNIRIYFRASTHILLSVIQTAGLLCHMLVKMRCLYEEKTWVASACWFYWVGNRKRPDMRPGSRVDRNMLSFTCNCYLWSIHLANRSISTLAHSFSTVQFKSKGPAHIMLWISTVLKVEFHQVSFSVYKRHSNFKQFDMFELCWSKSVSSMACIGLKNAVMFNSF